MNSWQQAHQHICVHAPWPQVLRKWCETAQAYVKHTVGFSLCLRNTEFVEPTAFIASSKQTSSLSSLLPADTTPRTGVGQEQSGPCVLGPHNRTHRRATGSLLTVSTRTRSEKIPQVDLEWLTLALASSERREEDKERQVCSVQYLRGSYASLTPKCLFPRDCIYQRVNIGALRLIISFLLDAKVWNMRTNYRQTILGSIKICLESEPLHFHRLVSLEFSILWLFNLSILKLVY